MTSIVFGGEKMRPSLCIYLDICQGGTMDGCLCVLVRIVFSCFVHKPCLLL